ncbi:hypothetical protein GALMADRAFT_213369 [Galerina marginata CBS 339.88]|uniref:Ribonuclease H1 N-terminal domain-containing protein n=1 Tax=Galerina marginata (strain CBS 339.88) TaxID=685588 RepID=A0A067SN91_GALM3|nr:hypothetical protein GALMADRAFT_213369 [Galerina marginata CBS 339.88]
MLALTIHPPICSTADFVTASGQTFHGDTSYRSGFSDEAFLANQRRSYSRITQTTTTTTTTSTPFGLQVETVTRTVTTVKDAEREDDKDAEREDDKEAEREDDKDAEREDDKEAEREDETGDEIANNTSTLPTVRKYLPTHPSQLQFVGGKRVYVVTRAQLPGVYDSWQSVQAVIKGVKDPIFEGRADFADAKQVYTVAYEEGTVSATPIPGGGFDTGPYIDEPIELDELDSIGLSLLNLGIREYYIPKPSELEPPTTTYKYYLVTKGEAVGIFASWHQAAIRTERVKSRACYRKCDSWREALIGYSIAYKNGEVEVFPISGGMFDIPLRREDPEQLLPWPATWFASTESMGLTFPVNHPRRATWLVSTESIGRSWPLGSSRIHERCMPKLSSPPAAVAASSASLNEAGVSCALAAANKACQVKHRALHRSYCHDAEIPPDLTLGVAWLDANQKRVIRIALGLLMLEAAPDLSRPLPERLRKMKEYANTWAACFTLVMLQADPRLPAADRIAIDTAAVNLVDRRTILQEESILFEAKEGGNFTVNILLKVYSFNNTNYGLKSTLIGVDLKKVVHFIPFTRLDLQIEIESVLQDGGIAGLVNYILLQLNSRR